MIQKPTTELVLIRTDLARDYTLGRLEIDGNYFCDTLENPVRADGVKLNGHTAIPKGRYRVIFTESPRFKRKLPLLLNVPQFSGVRIHSGNSVKDTAGCPLVGKKCDICHLYDSRKTSDVLNIVVEAAIREGNEVYITIRDYV